MCGLVVILLFAGAQIRTAQRDAARTARIEFLRDSMTAAHVRDSIRTEFVRDSTAEADRAAVRREQAVTASADSLAAIRARYEAGRKAAEEQRRRFEATPRRTRRSPGDSVALSGR